MSQPNPGNDPKRTIMVDGQPVDIDTFMQMQSGVGGPIPMPKQRRNNGGCRLIFIILLLILIPVVLVFVFAGNILNSALSNFGGLGGIGDIVATVSSAVAPPETEAIDGDPSKFDPLVGLAQAQAMAGEDAKLATISATYVRADGTMDLTATYSPAPRTEYTFLREIERPADAPPVGVAGSTAGQWYEPITIEAYQPGQSRRVTTTSGGMRTTFTYVNEGMTKQVEDPTTNPFDEIAPEPTCDFVDLWKSAIQEGAPEDAVAIIDYDEEGYTFNIVGTIVVRFDHDCAVL